MYFSCMESPLLDTERCENGMNEIHCCIHASYGCRATRQDFKELNDVSTSCSAKARGLRSTQIRVAGSELRMLKSLRML